MILGISSVNINSKFGLQKQYVKRFYKGKSAKMIRNIGLAFTTAGLLTLASCKKSNNTFYNNDDIVEIKTNNQEMDCVDVDIEKQKNGTKNVKTSYYYFPSENEINANNYSWTKKEYPDGHVEIDSLEYKISISPKGERTEIKTEKDEQGIETVTTTLPDGIRIVKRIYPPTKENEIIYTEKTYRSDSTLKEIYYYNEYPTDSIHSYTDKKIVETRDYYNEKGILVKWEKSGNDDPERSECFNKYDNKKRLIYDDIGNETYKYKKDSMTPYMSTAVNDNCKRITLYNNDGSVQKVYFEASDGTITE